MPESVTDRCTKAHEYIFLMSKSQKYFYNADAIKYPVLDESIKRVQSAWNGNEERSYINGKQNNLSKYYGTQKAVETTMANKRSVWTVTTKPYSEAHFATFPEDLIVDCIKAGCPEGGIVLDPFMGAGTTALVAKKLNRNYVGFELNPEYIKIAERRIYNQIGLFL
jgi:DNA modification methylase